MKQIFRNIYFQLMIIPIIVLGTVSTVANEKCENALSVKPTQKYKGTKGHIQLAIDFFTNNSMVIAHERYKEYAGPVGRIKFIKDLMPVNALLERKEYKGNIGHAKFEKDFGISVMDVLKIKYDGEEGLKQFRRDFDIPHIDLFVLKYTGEEGHIQFVNDYGIPNMVKAYEKYKHRGRIGLVQFVKNHGTPSMVEAYEKYKYRGKKGFFQFIKDHGTAHFFQFTKNNYGIDDAVTASRIYAISIKNLLDHEEYKGNTGHDKFKKDFGMSVIDALKLIYKGEEGLEQFKKDFGIPYMAPHIIKYIGFEGFVQYAKDNHGGNMQEAFVEHTKKLERAQYSNPKTYEADKILLNSWKSGKRSIPIRWS